MTNVTVHGTCDEAFAGVREGFANNFAQDLDVGASVCVVHNGRTVVDLWGGEIDNVDGVRGPWKEDSIVNVWSTTKTMAALTMLVLVDRGLLDADAPVSAYWPEFAVNGKDGVLVRHVLAHSAGLSGIEVPTATEELCDHNVIAARLGAQAPWWEPGTASGYHAITQGYLENEIVRRITGRTLGVYFAEEIAGPLGGAYGRNAIDFHIGTAASCDERVGRVIPPSSGLTGASTEPDSLAFRTFSNPAFGAEFSWTEQWRRAEVPAANGHGNARSVAQAQAVVSHGGEVNGVRLLSEATVARIFEEQSDMTDLVLGIPFRLGIGYGLVSPSTPISPNARACFWGGWGGSLVVNDLDSRMTFAYVMNRMGEGTVGDVRAGLMLFAAHAAAASTAG